MSGKLFLFFVLAFGVSRGLVFGFSDGVVQVDVFTQYSAPWGGQGVNMASDAFPPQGLVELRARVTFQGDGVHGKPVSYVLEAPNGAAFSATVFTQEDGVAVLRYSLPGSLDSFGLWTVRASVEVAGRVASDTLWFLECWLVEVRVDGPPVALKGDIMEVNVTLARICVQDPTEVVRTLVTDSDGRPLADCGMRLCVSVTDELGQFVAMSKMNISMAACPSAYDFCAFVRVVGVQWDDHADLILKSYSRLGSRVTVGVSLSSWAFSGWAKVHANVITSHPVMACCPEDLDYVWLQSRPAVPDG